MNNDEEINMIAERFAREQAYAQEQAAARERITKEQERLESAKDALIREYAARLVIWISPLVAPKNIRAFTRGWLLAETVEEDSSSYAPTKIVDSLYVTSKGRIVGNISRFSMEDVKHQIARYVAETGQPWTLL